jgi:hypothetical protein
MLNLNSHQQKALQVKEIKALQSKIEETAARKFAASLWPLVSKKRISG